MAELVFSEKMRIEAGLEIVHIRLLMDVATIEVAVASTVGICGLGPRTRGGGEVKWFRVVTCECRRGLLKRAMQHNIECSYFPRIRHGCNISSKMRSSADTSLGRYDETLDGGT